MAFDDDDDDVLTQVSPATAQAAAATNNPEAARQAAEDALEDEEAHDFRSFAASLSKKGVSSQSIRKGEKDFEAHGTRAQESALEQSRRVFEEVLSYTRVHKAGTWVRGWYFPDTWVDAPAEGDDGAQGDAEAPSAAAGKSKAVRPALARERVVVVEDIRGTLLSSMGRVIPGTKRDQPAFGKLWLLPEEALFLLERGNLDLWWPTRKLEELFPAQGSVSDGEGTASPPKSVLATAEDEFDVGLPLSLQAAYSLLIGQDGERGKISLQKYQVYSHLKRAGHHVHRAVALPPSPTLRGVVQPTSVWQWLFSLLSSSHKQRPPPLGPLVRPGIYHSYKPIYEQLYIIPRHKPTPEPSPSTAQVQEPFKVFFHIWKSGGVANFSVTRPPPPDFYLAVVDAQETALPTLGEISALLDSTPWCPPTNEKWKAPHLFHPRLKHGFRNVLVAINDHGIINYMRFGEGAFGEESLSHRFDWKTGPRGAKQGGGRGRGGHRGGRGRGGRGRR
ncbi:uncharacterized protein E0L32_008500 [Thyridium curvatum]|uniref:tRNA-splicing endonuclease subunit Sen54 N-terminal domain-containing protein n=1 Tax=Thyridium curvatum TaxID=1093900 RepID=A0A507AVW5_9PEZI|nr:uncharacterized protein E0L32_008500 [Thyridium curvatum]TPX10614.1 hypothetical protein E0L32_008500 [Thyridium curvatum]